MYRHNQLYLWMIIPMLLMQVGIFMDYWGDFSRNSWDTHVHYWTSSVWYIFLISQPYLINQNQVERHRTFGIIGFFIAGAVAFTAFSMLARATKIAHFVENKPGAIGAFDPWFFYGVAVIEAMMIVGFVIAVCQAIIHRKSIDDHRWWLITTVFMIMQPATSRGFQYIWVESLGLNDPRVVMQPLYLSLLMIVVMTLVSAKALNKLRHPATFLTLFVLAFCFLLEPLGKNEMMQSALTFILRS